MVVDKNLKLEMKLGVSNACLEAAVLVYMAYLLYCHN